MPCSICKMMAGMRSLCGMRRAPRVAVRCLLLMMLVPACDGLSPTERQALLVLSPPSLPAPPADVTNRYADDAAAAALGKTWFFETGFSGALLDGDNDGGVHALGNKGDTGKVACAGCHQPEAGFLDGRTLGQQISLASGWGSRRAPSLLDVGQAKLVMWDGRHDALYNQPFGPIESTLEMNSSRLYVAQQIFARFRAQYEAVFGPMPPLDDAARFPALDAVHTGCQPSSADPKAACNGTRHGMPGDGAEYDSMTPDDQSAVTRVVVNFGKALGAYERTLSCGTSRFDAWMHGSGTLSDEEQRGARLFVGKAGCTSCHSGPYMSDQAFHNLGMKPAVVAVVFLDANDHGAATGLAAAVADPLNVAGVFSDGNDGRLVPPNSASEGAFRTPTLRCVGKRPSLMHTGQLRTLDDAVGFHTRGGDANGYFGKNELTALDLGPSDVAALSAFLRALDRPGVTP